jgi:hypothetical protein
MDELELEQAAFEGNNKLLQAILIDKPELIISYEDFIGNSLLHLAAAQGDLQHINFLIALGADVNKKGDNGETPIYSAVRNSNLDAVKLLIKYGAKIKVGNNQSETPVAVAEYYDFGSSHEIYNCLTNQWKIEAKNTSEEFYNLGNQLLLEEKITDAIAAYGNAILYTYNHGPAYLNRGKAHLKQNNLKAACSDWEKAASFGMKDAYRLLWAHSPTDYDFEKSPQEAKDKIVSSVRRLLNRMTEEPSFENLVRHVILNKGKDTANSLFKTLQFGWENCGNSPANYCKVYCKVFYNDEVD